ncbi:methyltransferase domain-containing protein [Terrimonas ferruginea]|uniref:methyltransferase domain-containing protein n=1 Tax=Terrimonas ferruginea TaxID=249 RepID=UPI0004273198|nr:methyltransferase domain-containing protein [Terrimonas ferruginea]
MFLLMPGRHHLVTQFQFSYLQQLVQSFPGNVNGLDGISIERTDVVEGIVFPVTSANHSNTRRNPVPFYLRAMMLQSFGQLLGVPVYVYGIDDVGEIGNYASYTLKRISHESEGRLTLSPVNTLVICSTPVLTMYRDLGFSILPAELSDSHTWSHHTEMPWDLVQFIAENKTWDQQAWLTDRMHTAALRIWQQYGLGEKVQWLFHDQMIGQDGDLTETRDYNVYVRQMDEIAGVKFADTISFIQPGRVGDIGCAVGSWIKYATIEPSLRESDFYGIEVSRFLFEICQQRKTNREFNNPFVFFSQKNAVTGLVFPQASMNTIHTSSLTHEIESYGGREDLLQFIANRYEELVPGGVWINRDVVGPADKNKPVRMWLNQSDGKNEEPLKEFATHEELAHHLASLSTQARFLRFARDFRRTEGYVMPVKWEEYEGEQYACVSLQDATEFLSRKDYTDNWTSEMHETFCFWDFEEWQAQLKTAGFSIHTGSKVFRNEWIVKNRWEQHARLFTLENDRLIPEEYPVTTMILIGVRQ